MEEHLFPEIKKSIEDFIYEEEGNITRNKVIAMGTMMLILSLMMYDEVFAAHRSHSSHSSHASPSQEVEEEYMEVMKVMFLILVMFHHLDIVAMDHIVIVHIAIMQLQNQQQQRLQKW